MNLFNTIEGAIRKREHLFGNSGTNAFRLFNGAGDLYSGLSIDYYNGFLLLGVYDSALKMYTIEIGSHCNTILNEMNIPVHGIVSKDRTMINNPQAIAESRKSILISGEMPPDRHIVKQNGILVYVDLIHGQNTGLFLDMRTVRNRLTQCYRNGSLCNLFCYTGVFAVHALNNGLQHAVNVDISLSVLNRAKRNYIINAIEPDGRDFVKSDCREYLKKTVKHQRHFTCIIFDPPTFSRNKKQSFSVKKHYKEYCSLMASIAPGGYVLTAINAVSIDINEYKALHPHDWKLQFLEHESDDFPYTKEPYLKAGLWKIV